MNWPKLKAGRIDKTVIPFQNTMDTVHAENEPMTSDVEFGGIPSTNIIDFLDI